MARIIDLSTLKKEDIEIVSLKGITYTIPGNFASEYMVKIYKTQEEVKKLKEPNFLRY